MPRIQKAQAFSRKKTTRSEKEGALKVILYSNTKNNGPAVQLYRKLGFQEIALEPGVYKRADIKMEIKLHL